MLFFVQVVESGRALGREHKALMLESYPFFPASPALAPNSARRSFILAARLVAASWFFCASSSRLQKLKFSNCSQGPDSLLLLRISHSRSQIMKHLAIFREA
jgi:hypothetical protein